LKGIAFSKPYSRLFFLGVPPPIYFNAFKFLAAILSRTKEKDFQCSKEKGHLGCTRKAPDRCTLTQGCTGSVDPSPGGTPDPCTPLIHSLYKLELPSLPCLNCHDSGSIWFSFQFYLATNKLRAAHVKHISCICCKETFTIISAAKKNTCGGRHEVAHRSGVAVLAQGSSA
jgi:hypothetical protein